MSGICVTTVCAGVKAVNGGIFLGTAIGVHWAVSKDESDRRRRMAEFESWRSFQKFRREVVRERRYIRTREADSFLDAVAATCGQRVKTVPTGWIAWRAQIGCDWRQEEDYEMPCPLPVERMEPLTDRASEGRVNPKGIPCLYLATTRETAMSEVRPWVGSLVSVAQFRIVRELRVVDCSVNHSEFAFYFAEGSPEERVKAVWTDIDRAYAQPTTRTDDTADYTPTQVLAELFRDRGFDGLVYKSAFGENGYNVALFDVEAAVPLNCELFETKGIECVFDHMDGPYFVRSQE